MAFKEHKRYEADSHIVTVILDNSEVVAWGAPVQLRNGNAEIGVAGQAVMGHVTGFVDRNGKAYEASTATRGTSTSTGAARGLVVTVAADNETVDLIAVQVETSKKYIYSATITGTMDTTSSSNKPGGWVNLVYASGNATVDETTHSRTITSVRTHKNHGVDPGDSSRMLVSVNASEMWDFSGTAMA